MRFEKGEILKADKLNQLAGEGPKSPSPGLHGSNGRVALAEGWTGWIKITSSGTTGTYNWIEMISSSSGSLVEGYKTGTKTYGTAAREINGNNAIPNGAICRAWASVFEVHFQGNACP